MMQPNDFATYRKAMKTSHDVTLQNEAAHNVRLPKHNDFKT